MADDDNERRDSGAPPAPAKGVLEQRAFDALEKEIKEFLTEIQDERSLDRFRMEYEKLHRAVKKQHEFEKKLHKQCRELSSDISKNLKKISAAQKMNEEDQATIQSLKTEIDKNWVLVDDSQEKEAETNKQIKVLKVEIADLSKIAESGVTETMAEDTQVRDLELERAKVIRERDIQFGQLQDLRKELEEWNDKVRLTEQEKINVEHELGLLKDEFSSKKAECDRENKRKDRLEKEMKELRAQMESKQNDLKIKQAQLLEGQEQIDRLDIQLKEQKGHTDKAQKELDLVLQKVAKVTSELEEQIKNNTSLMAENSQKQADVKQKDEEIEFQKQEIIKVSKVRDATLNKLKATEFAREDLEKQKYNLIEERMRIEKEIEMQKKQAEHSRKHVEESMRERDMLDKMKTQVENSIVKQEDLMVINQVTIHNLKVELEKYCIYILKQSKSITALENETNKKNMEVQENGLKYMAACEELHKWEVASIEVQKQIADWESKIRQQQNLYEVVRTERNVNSKRLVEAQDEIDEMKRKFKVMNHIVEQLKEEINSKDFAIIKEHADHQKIEKEREHLKAELIKAQLKIKLADVVVSDHITQIDNLNHILEEANVEQLRQTKEHEIIKSERRVLGAQLIKKNNELTLVYDKIRIQDSTIYKGHIDYQNRLHEISALKMKLNNLKREYTILTGTCKNIEVLRREVHNLRRQLMQERTKVKALTEELENPLNVHRWRKLEGTDPQSYEMIIKIQTLQKKLTIKTEEVIEKDLLIQEKEKLYIELRKILARQPGAEVAEQVAKYGSKLQDKMKNLMYITSELSNYQVQVDMYKADIDIYTEELEVVKQKYFAKKRDELSGQMKEITLPSPTKAFKLVTPLPNRNIGGGYNVEPSQTPELV